MPAIEKVEPAIVFDVEFDGWEGAGALSASSVQLSPTPPGNRRGALKGRIFHAEMGCANGGAGLQNRGSLCSVHS